jgi:UDP-N-acetyl-D-glucosamine dehydrogenase
MILALPPADELRSRIESRTARVAVIGLGQVGLPLAEAFASAGYMVLGFDSDPDKVRDLRTGRSSVRQIPSERVAELLTGGMLDASRDIYRLKEADAIVLCVPTPLTEAEEPDLSHVLSAGQAVRDHLRRGQLVVLGSSTYPGTTEEVLRPLLEQSGLRAGRDFFLAYSPDRHDLGDPLRSAPDVPRVVGGVDPASRDLAAALYGRVVNGVVAVSGARVAEACKLLENTYRAVNVGLVNELKVVFERMGIDVWEVIEAARTKPFGFQAFYPGPGLGGRGAPAHPFYLTWAARKYGVSTRFIELAGEVNAAMPAYVVNRVAEALNAEGKPLKGSRVCILGVAYKKDVESLHGSPSLAVLDLLSRRGARVSYNDPYVAALPAPGHCPPVRLASEALTGPFLASQDCVVILTDHSCYHFDWVVRNAPLVVDTRNATKGLAGGPCRVWKA